MGRTALVGLLVVAAACSFPEVDFREGGSGGSGGAPSAGGAPTTVGAYPSTGGTGGTPSGGAPASGGSGGGAPSCIDQDGDLYVAVTSDPSCLDDPRFKPVFDCFDNNDKAHPGQTSFYNSHRGDGSFDYDCDSVEEGFYAVTCNTSTKSLVTTDGTTGCGSPWPRKSVKVALACVDDGTDTQSCR